MSITSAIKELSKDFGEFALEVVGLRENPRAREVRLRCEGMENPPLAHVFRKQYGGTSSVFRIYHFEWTSNHGYTHHSVIVVKETTRGNSTVSVEKFRKRHRCKNWEYYSWLRWLNNKGYTSVPLVTA